HEYRLPHAESRSPIWTLDSPLVCADNAHDDKTLAGDIIMSRFLVSLFVLVLSALPALAADNFLVKDGQARAEVVIAETPPRSTRLAAHELRRQVEKITGARLSIVTAPTGKVPVRVFVGRSPHTDRLKISADGLRHGAYRITSGDDWLVLI